MYTSNLSFRILIALYLLFNCENNSMFSNSNLLISYFSFFIKLLLLLSILILYPLISSFNFSIILSLLINFTLNSSIFCLLIHVDYNVDLSYSLFLIFMFVTLIFLLDIDLLHISFNQILRISSLLDSFLISFFN